MLALIVLLVIALIVLMRATVVLKNNERGVILRLGRELKVAGPGVVLVLPVIDRMIRVSVAEQQVVIPAVEALTSDQRSVTLSARLSYRIVDPMRATTAVADLPHAIPSLLETSLQGLIRESEYEHLTAHLGEAARETTRRMEPVTSSWGVGIASVDLDRARF